MRGTEESKIKRLEGTIRRRDRQIEKLQKELEAKQKHLDRVKNDLLPPVYQEIKNVIGQRDEAKASVAIIQAWICAILVQEDLAEVRLPNDLVSTALEKFKLKAEKDDDGVILWVETVEEQAISQRE